MFLVVDSPNRVFVGDTLPGFFFRLEPEYHYEFEKENIGKTR